MNRHRGVARLSLCRIPAGPTLARLTSGSSSSCARSASPTVIAYFGGLMGLCVGAYAFEESIGLASPTGEELPPEEIVGMLRDYVASLPPDRFPATRGTVDLLFAGDAEERFRSGIELAIRGLETYADRER
jgi:hypothetical protein